MLAFSVKQFTLAATIIAAFPVIIQAYVAFSGETSSGLSNAGYMSVEDAYHVKCSGKLGSGDKNLSTWLALGCAYVLRRFSSET